MYIIYTNLSPKQPNLPSVPPPSLNKVAIPVPTNTRIANSLKNHSSNNLIRERASTILLPSTKFNLVVPVRSNSIGSEQPMATNIPTERNVEYFRSAHTTLGERDQWLLRFFLGRSWSLSWTKLSSRIAVKVFGNVWLPLGRIRRVLLVKK